MARRSIGLFVLAAAACIANAALGWFEPPHGYYDLKGSPWSDALSYHLDAIDVVHGLGLREAFFPVTLRAVRAPGFILWLASLYTVFGSGVGPAAARGLNVLLYAGVAVISYRLTARAFGERVGLFCGAAVALSRTAMDFTQYLMTEVPSMALVAAALLLVVREREAPTRRGLGAGVAGLALGLATTMRTIAGLEIPLVLGYLLWRRVRDGSARRTALLCLVAAALPLGALAVRNRVTVGTSSIAATAHVWTAWAEFATPNPDADDARYAQAFYPRVHEPEAAIQEELRHGFWSWALDHPLAYARRVYFLALSNFQMPPFGQGADLAAIVVVPLVLLAFAGAWRSRRRPLVLLLALSALGTVLGNAAFGNSSGRFRVPVDFLLTIVLGGGVLAALGIGAGEAAGEPLAAPDARREATPWPRTARLAVAGLACVPLLAFTLMLTFASLIAGQGTELQGSLPAAPVRFVEEQLGDPSLAAAFAAQVEQGGLPSYDAVRDRMAQAGGDGRGIDGTFVLWNGEVTPLAHLAPGESDPRSALLGPRGYGRELASLLAYGEHGALDGEHVWLEIPDGTPWTATGGEVMVIGRIELEPKSAVYERFRVRAIALLPLQVGLRAPPVP